MDHHHDQEMHELNQEADFLEQKVKVEPNGGTMEVAKRRKQDSDPDAQAMVIESLRSQVQDLYAQVSQLNSKLVKSYDRVSDLEDELHVTSSNLRQATVKISQLELERTQHLAALSTGLLVEKDQVTAELTRLMEKATEEAARRGQAESARADIEKDLDDLSAGLFDQANRMVAEARFARALSEQKVTETEQALKSAEEVVGVLQTQMQALQAEKEQAERRVEEMRATMGKGKWVARPERTRTAKLRLLCTHLPYHEFLQFIGHLRTIRPATQYPPAISTLLTLPLLGRLISEDSDPTVRLDLAPSLNWLTRRSVISAIHNGQLTVEPMSTSTLLEELSTSNIPGLTHHTHVACALCGATILESTSSSAKLLSPSRTGSWSSASALFRNPLHSISNASTPTNVPSTPSALALHNAPPSEPPAQIYIFRLATSSSGLPVSLPMASQQANQQARPTIYPLCTSEWCLTRLRTTCSLWAFVRTGIVEKIWEETPYVPPASETPKTQSEPGSPSSEATPPVPPRKSRIGALWGTMQRGLSGSKESESPVKTETSEQRTASPASPSPTTKRRLPPPPPSHPPLKAPIPKLAQPQPSGVPPSVPQTKSTPPPLPQRNRIRDEHAASSRAQSPALPLRTSSSTPSVNGVPSGGEDGAEYKEVIQSGVKESSQATLLATELTRSESHSDHLATPIEEYPPSETSRPMSPATVPLPPSAPTTPVPVVSSLPSEQQTAETPLLVPEEQAAPAPTSIAPSTTEAVPASTSITPTTEPAPAPPPLPRRAAGRRPVPSLPVVPAAEPQPISINSTTEEKSTEAIKLADSSPKDHVAPDSQDQQHDTSVSEQTDDVVLVSRDDETIKETTSIPPEDMAVASHAPEIPESDDRASQSSVEKVSTSPAVSEVDAIEDHDIKLNGIRDDTQEKEGNEEELSHMYVSDATWEERTWKELVRLREDMFWARLGGRR